MTHVSVGAATVAVRVGAASVEEIVAEAEAATAAAREGGGVVGFFCTFAPIFSGGMLRLSTDSSSEPPKPNCHVVVLIRGHNVIHRRWSRLL
jgi:hypothetical protein